MSTYRWDVFISHASEDKAKVARPLAEKLRAAGVRVWLDANELTLGDSLRRKIDHGLAQSRYGVVVLSPAFFGKEWPQNELNGLFALESTRSKVILPIWHEVDKDYITRYSPLLADRLGISTAAGLEKVCDAVLRAIHEPILAPLPPPASHGSRTTLLIASAAFLLVVAVAVAWAIRSYWKGNPLAKLETPAVETAAAALFREQSIAAGYVNVEILESWVGDFLFEHWIDTRVIARFLTQKSSAQEQGDIAIGIWSDPTAQSSVWRIYSGLTTPNVRPAFSGPVLTMKAGSIEPSTGPYRDAGAGLSVTGSSLVLGAYTKSYSSHTSWICSNFAPSAAPFIDPRPKSDSFEQFSIQPESPKCPPIKFLALQKPSNESPVDRFRALLNLPALTPDSEVKESIYVSVARDNDPHPLPIRVSLLWLRRAVSVSVHTGSADENKVPPKPDPSGRNSTGRGAAREMIQLTFAGSITNPGEVLHIAAGDTFTAVLTYDAGTPPLHSDISTARYAPYELSATVHNQSFGDQMFSGDPGSNLLVAHRASFGDGFLTNGTGCRYCAGFNFSDSTARAFSGLALPRTLEINRFDSRTFAIAAGAAPAIGKITSIEVAAIPSTRSR